MVLIQSGALERKQEREGEDGHPDASYAPPQELDVGTDKPTEQWHD
jgi:hypothetical protein